MYKPVIYHWSCAKVPCQAFGFLVSTYADIGLTTSVLSLERICQSQGITFPAKGYRTNWCSPVECRSCVDAVADVSPVSYPLLSQMAIRISV